MVVQSSLIKVRARASIDLMNCDFSDCSMFLALDSRCLADALALPSSGMALVRILVDGYSLLHNWPELAPGKPRHSEDARGELIRILTLYRDACGTPITIVFDGAGKAPATAYPSTPEVEILYSRTGQTADQIIERVTVRMEPFGEVLAVTDDFAERDTVAYHGGLVSSCANFIETVERTLLDQERDIHRHNRRQGAGFKAPR